MPATSGSSSSWSSTTAPTSTRGSSALAARRPAAPSATSTCGATPDTNIEEARIIFIDYEVSNWTWDPIAKAYYWHRFYACQPDLNFDNPLVVREIKDILNFWLDLGVDGFRLDAVPYLVEREGTNGENLAETHNILKMIRAEVERRRPECVLLAEANQARGRRCAISAVATSATWPFTFR